MCCTLLTRQCIVLAIDMTLHINNNNKMEYLVSQVGALYGWQNILKEDWFRVSW